MVAAVVTFNRVDQLRTTLGRLLESPEDILQAVVLVDNCSTDGTTAFLETITDPRLVVLRPPRNLGGAGGFESAMRLAVSRFDPDWLVLMDDDGRPEPGALADFISRDRSVWEACAAAVRQPDGHICGMNRPVLNPFRDRAAFFRTLFGGGRAGFHLQDDAYDEGAPERAIHGASFVGCFVSRAAIQRVGYPDGTLFIYAEDGLYTLGLTQAGGRMAFLPDIRFEHDCSTFAGTPGRLTPLWKVYYYHRNLLLLYRLAAGPWFWPALMIVVPKWISQIRLYRGERLTYGRLLRRALWDGLRRRHSADHAEILRLARNEPVQNPRS